MNRQEELKAVFGGAQCFCFAACLAILLALVSGGCGWFSGEGDNNPGKRGAAAAAGPKKPQMPRFRIPVTVERISRGPMNAYLQAVGTIRPIKEIEIKAEMTGRIYFEKRWEDGDYVEAKTLLARIDDTTVRLDLREAERALEQAQRDLVPAKAVMERRRREAEFAEKMYKRGAYSEVQYEQARLSSIQAETQYQQALITVETRRTQIEKLKKELEKASIYAPFAGILLPAQPPQAGQASAQETDLTLLEGTLIGSGQTVLRLADIRQVVVELDVPAKDIDLVDLGQTVELDIYSKAGRRYVGTVSDISSTLNPTTRTFTVKVIVDNPLGELRPGMFSKARIITETRLDAISIPRELLMLRNNKYVVFVVEEKKESRSELGKAGEPAGASTRGATMSPHGPKNEENRPRGNRTIAIAAVAAASAPVGQATAEMDPDVSPEELQEDQQSKVMVAKQREVKLGIENREAVEITEGLREGDLLVVLGYETLTDDVEVNVSYRTPEEGAESEEEQRPL